MAFATAFDPLLQLTLAVEVPTTPVSDLGLAAPMLRFALLGGVGAIVLSLVLISLVLVLRLRLLARQRRERRFTDVWRPLMIQWIERGQVMLPRIAARDRVPFLMLWNHYGESLLGDAKARLNRLAAATGMVEVARQMLREGELREQLIAVVTLGHIGDRSLWQEMRALAQGPSPVLSLAAAQAMLRIDPDDVLAWVVPLAAHRGDWSFPRVAAMLDEAGVDRVTPVLASALVSACDEEADAERLSRLLHLSSVAHAGELAPSVRRILSGRDEPRVIADALSVLGDPRDVGLARRYAAHESWEVRVAAAKALGRLGTPEDRPLLAGLLSDANWWVRYRAAHALAAMPFIPLEELRILRRAMTDRHAARALDQAIAERS